MQRLPYRDRQIVCDMLMDMFLTWTPRQGHFATVIPVGPRRQDQLYVLQMWGLWFRRISGLPKHRLVASTNLDSLRWMRYYWRTMVKKPLVFFERALRLTRPGKVMCILGSKFPHMHNHWGPMLRQHNLMDNVAGMRDTEFALQVRVRHGNMYPLRRETPHRPWPVTEAHTAIVM